MLKRKLRKLECLRWTSDRRFEVPPGMICEFSIGFSPAVGDCSVRWLADDHPLYRREAIQQSANFGKRFDLLPVVLAVSLSHQEFGSDLGEPIDNRIVTEVG